MASDKTVQQIVGNVGGVPEEKDTTKGKVVNFSVAVTKNYEQKLTTWVRVSVWNEGLRAWVMANISTGKPVAVEGYIDIKQQDGKTYYNMTGHRVGLVSFGTNTPRQQSTPAVEVPAGLAGWK